MDNLQLQKIGKIILVLLAIVLLIYIGLIVFKLLVGFLVILGYLILGAAVVGLLYLAWQFYSKFKKK
jgi:hypothetical protein